MDMHSGTEIKIDANELSHEGTQPSTKQPVTRALSDGSREDTPAFIHKHKWTVEQRLTLALLAEFYSNDWNEKTTVFNRFHRSHIRRGGLRRAVVHAQWIHMRNWFDATDSLRKLHATLSPYDRLEMASRPVLEKQALDIGIKLNATKATNSSNRTTMSDTQDIPDLKRKRAETDFLPNDYRQTVSHSQTVHGLTILPKTPTKTHERQRDNGLLTPPDSRGRKVQRLTVDKKLARIGFRASTAQSQGTYCSVLGIRGMCIQSPHCLFPPHI